MVASVKPKNACAFLSAKKRVYHSNDQAHVAQLLNPDKYRRKFAASNKPLTEACIPVEHIIHK